MTVLTFPSGPTVGQIYNAPNEVIYVFDGTKWTVETTASSSEAVSNSTQDRVAPMFVDGPHEGISFTYNAETNTMSAAVTAVNGDQLINGSQVITLGSNGVLTVPDNNFEIRTPSTGSGNKNIDIYTNSWNGNGVEVYLQHNDKVSIITNNGGYEWSFDKTGRTQFPNNLYIENSVSSVTIGQDDTETTLNLYSAYGMELSTAGGPMRLEVGAAFYGLGDNMVILAGQGGEPSLNGSSDGGELIMSAGHAGFNDGAAAKGGDAYISGGNAANGQGGHVHLQGGYGDGGIAGSIILKSHQTVWTFDNNGNIQYPGDITQGYKDNTNCPAGVDTVIYTGTHSAQHAIKLFVMVEGTPDGGTLWETQACDIIAVRGFTNDIVHVTAYGVTYSSATAFATFDGQWNAITGRMEITCSPTSATNNVRASVHAIEMRSND